MALQQSIAYTEEAPPAARYRPWAVALQLSLMVLVVLYSLPTLGVIITSIKTDAQISREGLWTIPNTLNWANYVEIFERTKVLTYLTNSFKVAIPATILSVVGGVLTGYVFSKLPFRFSAGIFIVIVAGMFFPPQVLLIPLFKLYNGMGLYDTLYPIIITHTALGLPICALLMRNFFATVPNSLRQAALLDGANELQILFLVMVPISLPAIAVLSTLQFTWIWHDFLWPLIFLQSDEKRTIMVGLVALEGEFSTAWGTQAAMAVIASIPTLVIFIFFKRYFLQGMTLGAVKG